MWTFDGTFDSVVSISCAFLSHSVVLCIQLNLSQTTRQNVKPTRRLREVVAYERQDHRGVIFGSLIYDSFRGETQT